MAPSSWRILYERVIYAGGWSGGRTKMNVETINKEDLLFYISKETMQYEAMQKIGRHLTEEELDIAIDGLDWGLMTDIDTVYNTILFEMIKK